MADCGESRIDTVPAFRIGAACSMDRTEETRRARLPNVVKAMGLIRPLFDAQRCDVVPFTDHAIATALLALCPERVEWWLSPDHICQAFERLRFTQSQ
jgi:hypothetical protein